MAGGIGTKAAGTKAGEMTPGVATGGMDLPVMMAEGKAVAGTTAAVIDSLKLRAKTGIAPSPVPNGCRTI